MTTELIAELNKCLEEANKKVASQELTIAELRRTMSENNQFYGEQLSTIKALNSELKLKIKWLEQ